MCEQNFARTLMAAIGRNENERWEYVQQQRAIAAEAERRISLTGWLEWSRSANEMV